MTGPFSEVRAHSDVEQQSQDAREVDSAVQKMDEVARRECDEALLAGSRVVMLFFLDRVGVRFRRGLL
jgi:hypothetical protein